MGVKRNHRKHEIIELAQDIQRRCQSDMDSPAGAILLFMIEAIKELRQKWADEDVLE